MTKAPRISVRVSSNPLSTAALALGRRLGHFRLARRRLGLGRVTPFLAIGARIRKHYGPPARNLARRLPAMIWQSSLRWGNWWSSGASRRTEAGGKRTPAARSMPHSIASTRGSGLNLGLLAYRQPASLSAARRRIPGQIARDSANKARSLPVDASLKAWPAWIQSGLSDPNLRLSRPSKSRLLGSARTSSERIVPHEGGAKLPPEIAREKGHSTKPVQESDPVYVERAPLTSHKRLGGVTFESAGVERTGSSQRVSRQIQYPTQLDLAMSFAARERQGSHRPQAAPPNLIQASARPALPRYHAPSREPARSLLASPAAKPSASRSTTDFAGTDPLLNSLGVPYGLNATQALSAVVGTVERLVARSVEAESQRQRRSENWPTRSEEPAAIDVTDEDLVRRLMGKMRTLAQEERFRVGQLH